MRSSPFVNCSVLSILSPLSSENEPRFLVDRYSTGRYNEEERPVVFIITDVNDGDHSWHSSQYKEDVMKTPARLFSRFPGGVKVPSLLALAVILLAAWLIVESPLFHPTAPPGLHLTDLHSVGEFQHLFNQDVGTPRLVLILSPT